MSVSDGCHDGRYVDVCLAHMSIFVIFSSFSSDFHEMAPFSTSPPTHQTLPLVGFEGLTLSNVQDKMGSVYTPKCTLKGHFEVCQGM